MSDILTWHLHLKIKRRKLVLTFLFESEILVHILLLMITTDGKEVLGILNLVRKEQAHDLDGSRPTVHVVPEEQIVGTWRMSAIIKDPQ